MNTIEFLIIALAVSALFSLLYWQVCQFIILKRVRFQLFAMRDEARRIALERGLGANEHFHQLERFICKTITYSQSISFTSFVLFAVFNHKEMISDTVHAKEMERFANEAPKEFVSIKESTAKLSLIIMALNSPWMIVFASGAAIVLVALGKISRLGMYVKAEKFVENIEMQSGGCPEPA